MKSPSIYSGAVAAAALLLQSSYAFSATSNMMELRYFDLRGAAETTRIILALADQKYKDTRFAIDPANFDSPDFKEAKESGLLDANLQRVPILITDEGATIGQSKAIERFLAKKFNLMGSSDVEEAQIDCIAEHCRDVGDAAVRKGFSAFNIK